jgi:hypothetical protein
MCCPSLVPLLATICQISTSPILRIGNRFQRIISPSVCPPLRSNVVSTTMGNSSARVREMIHSTDSRRISNRKRAIQETERIDLPAVNSKQLTCPVGKILGYYTRYTRRCSVRQEMAWAMSNRILRFCVESWETEYQTTEAHFSKSLDIRDTWWNGSISQIDGKQGKRK